MTREQNGGVGWEGLLSAGPICQAAALRWVPSMNKVASPDQGSQAPPRQVPWWVKSERCTSMRPSQSRSSGPQGHSGAKPDLWRGGRLSWPGRPCTPGCVHSTHTQTGRCRHAVSLTPIWRWGGTRVPREDPHRYGRTHTLRRVPRRVPQTGPRPGIFPLSSALNEMTVFEDLLFAEDPGVGLGVEAPGARPAGAGLWPRGLGCTAGGDVASCWQG